MTRPGGHSLSYPRGHRTVGVGGDLDVLARHDPQQLDRCSQVWVPEAGAEPDDGLGVAEQLRDQSGPCAGVCPHDLRLALPVVVVTRQQPRQLRCGPGVDPAGTPTHLRTPDRIKVIV